MTIFSKKWRFSVKKHICHQKTCKFSSKNTVFYVKKWCFLRKKHIVHYTNITLICESLFDTKLTWYNYTRRREYMYIGETWNVQCKTNPNTVKMTSFSVKKHQNLTKKTCFLLFFHILPFWHLLTLTHFCVFLWFLRCFGFKNIKGIDIDKTVKNVKNVILENVILVFFT